MEREALLTLAREAAKNAHCPYSHFHVGAAVVAGDQVFTGVNIESSSYGLTLCAERSALAAALTAKASPITHIAISCADATNAPLQEKMPCGACRQWMADFLAPDAEIYIDGSERIFHVEDILPHPFKL